MKLKRGRRAHAVTGHAVGITGPSLQYWLDFTENWDKDEEYAHVGLSWNGKRDLGFLPLRGRAPVGCP